MEKAILSLSKTNLARFSEVMIKVPNDNLFCKTNFNLIYQFIPTVLFKSI